MRRSAAHAFAGACRPGRANCAATFRATLVRRRHQFRAAGERRHLRLARALEMHHEVERIVHRRPAHQQAVIAQDHRVVRAEVAHEPRLLVGVERDAFVVVVADGVR